MESKCFNTGNDPLEQLKVRLKGSCKKTKIVQHKNWSLLSGKGRVVADLAGKLMLGMGYAIASGVHYGVVEDAVKELETACRSTKSLDLVQQETSYAVLANFHQCLSLQRKISTRVIRMCSCG